MNMTKRILCAAAALLLCAAACSNGGAGEAKPDRSAEPSQSVPSGTPAPSPEDESPSGTQTPGPADSSEGPGAGPEDGQPSAEPSGEPERTPAPPQESRPAESAAPDGGNAEPPAASQAPEPGQAVDLAAVRQAMLDAAGADDPLLLDTGALSAMYGIETGWVAQSASFILMSGVFPDEVILVEAVDQEAAAQVAAKLQSKLDDTLNQAQLYDPESYAALQSCGVAADGLFVSLILSSSQAELAAVYHQYI